MPLAQRFHDRAQAGKLLARPLRAYAGRADAIVLALPRGGVPVGYALAQALALELDVLLVRKLGLPGHEEFAIGAVASGGVRVLHRDVIGAHGLSDAQIEAAAVREMAEIAARERRYRGERPVAPLCGRVAILVDDGMATGASMRAAVRAARQREPARIVVALPVGAPDSCAALAGEVDELVCLCTPLRFYAVSQWYEHFEQTSDGEVQELLSKAARIPHGGTK
ncbi:MAG: phosphoribosyltransferase family protein [Pseudomonadota bacterium]